MSLGPVRDWNAHAAMTNGKGGELTEIWVRKPTDLFDRAVPIFVYKGIGGGTTDLRHVVQVPPKVAIKTDQTIPRGMAVCVYSDGTYRRYGGRQMAVMRRGADLQRRENGTRRARR